MTTVRKVDIREAIDRFGADLGVWPDRDLAQAVRAAAEAEADVSAWLDDARALGAGLDKARAALDDEIDRSGGAGRIANVALAAVEVSRHRRVRWIAIAAMLLLAAGLGGVVELATDGSLDEPSLDVVILDPLVFGPAGIDQ